MRLDETGIPWGSGNPYFEIVKFLVACNTIAGVITRREDITVPKGRRGHPRRGHLMKRECSPREMSDRKYRGDHGGD